LKQHVHDAVAPAVSEAAAQSGVSRPEFAALQVPPGAPGGLGDGARNHAVRTGPHGPTDAAQRPQTPS
jgi:hypothetical protein